MQICPGPWGRSPSREMANQRQARAPMPFVGRWPEGRGVRGPRDHLHGPPGVLRLPSPVPVEPVPQPAGEVAALVITVDPPEPTVGPGLTYTPVEDPATVAPMTGRLTPDMSPSRHPSLAAVPEPPAPATVVPPVEGP
jgi:hypothetical protein